MLTDVALHMGLEAVGSATTACILLGCRNATHQHRGIVGLLARSRSARLILNGLLMLGSAYATVRILG